MLENKAKKKFSKPVIRVIKIEKEDLILTSGPGPIPPEEGNSFGTIRDGYKLF